MQEKTEEKQVITVDEFDQAVLKIHIELAVMACSNKWHDLLKNLRGKLFGSEQKND